MDNYNTRTKSKQFIFPTNHAEYYTSRHKLQQILNQTNDAMLEKKYIPILLLLL